jgi:hypothetical protein
MKSEPCGIRAKPSRPVTQTPCSAHGGLAYANNASIIGVPASAIQAPGFVRRNAAAAIGTAHAATEIQWWHSMTAVNNEWVNDLAKQFNESQKDYKVVPTFKGVYDESMTAAIAAFRSGNAPTSCRCLKWAPPP